MRKDLIILVILIVLLFLVYSGGNNSVNIFRSIGVYDLQNNYMRVIYGGESGNIIVTSYTDRWDACSSEFAGGSYANCCDNAYFNIYIYYPDGSSEKVKRDLGMVCAPQMLSDKFLHYFQKGKGTGTLRIHATLVCEENIGGSWQTVCALSSVTEKAEFSYYPQNPCEGVVCEPYCEGYTWYGNGECVPSDGSYFCLYNTVEEKSPKCGWIDSDGDGIPDTEDECPHQYGLAKFNGCPDTDGDGIPDNKDACPTEYGYLEYNGCPPPDSDSDGIPDNLDKCPHQYGLPQFDGCPDTDGDGIPDPDDLCPNEYGLQEYNGCPPPKEQAPAVTEAQPPEEQPPESEQPPKEIIRPSAPISPAPYVAPPEEELKRPVCGNGVCEAGENILNCPKDCLSKNTIINIVLVVIIIVLVVAILLKKY